MPDEGTERPVLDMRTGVVVRERPPCTPTPKKPWPDWLVWAPNRIWIWDVTHFSRTTRAVFAIVDMISRKWIDTLISVEETALS